MIEENWWCFGAVYAAGNARSSEGRFKRHLVDWIHPYHTHSRRDLYVAAEDTGGE